MTIAASEIRNAVETLNGQVVRTPIVRSGGLNDALAADIFLKLVTLQRTRSFKDRGEFVKLKQVAQEKNNGIMEISGGWGISSARCRLPRATLGSRSDHRYAERHALYENHPIPRIRCTRRSRRQFRQRCQTLCRRNCEQRRTRFCASIRGYAHHRRIRNHRTGNAG